MIFDKEYILVPWAFLKIKPRWTLENGMISTIVDKTAFGISPLSMFIVLSPACVFPMCRLSSDERLAVLSGIIE